MGIETAEGEGEEEGGSRALGRFGARLCAPVWLCGCAVVWLCVTVMADYIHLQIYNGKEPPT